jgi:hypothetical protein
MSEPMTLAAAHPAIVWLGQKAGGVVVSKVVGRFIERDLFGHGRSVLEKAQARSRDQARAGRLDSGLLLEVLDTIVYIDDDFVQGMWAEVLSAGGDQELGANETITAVRTLKQLAPAEALALALIRDGADRPVVLVKDRAKAEPLELALLRLEGFGLVRRVEPPGNRRDAARVPAPIDNGRIHVALERLPTSEGRKRGASTAWWELTKPGVAFARSVALAPATSYGELAQSFEVFGDQADHSSDLARDR